VRAWYEGRRDAVQRDLGAVVAGAGELAAREVVDTLVRLADAERDAVRRAWRADLVAEAGMEEVLAELDDRTSRLRHVGHAERTEDALDAVLRTDDARGAE
jgi:hypothetical protein